MASGERRLGSGRRGMTVLGKIPTPSVPKPINLPSQRLENRGLEPNVELVPRGTFSWGSAGRSSAVGARKEGGSGISSSPPTSSVAWNVALKIQDLSASPNEAGSLAESNRPSSAGNGTRPSSAPTAATNRVWCSSAKTKVEVQVQSSGFTVNPVEPVTLGSQTSADLTPQQKNVLLNRPTSADGTVVDRDIHPHPGVNARASAGPSPAGPGREGFQHPGDGYTGHRPFAWQGMPPAGGQELPVGPGPYSGPLPHEVYYSPFGVPQYSNVKDRDMVVVRMVNGPGAYGSYPPHIRPAECFGPPGIYGSYGPTTRHGEQLTMSGNSAMGGSSCAPGMNIGFFPDGNKYSFQEGDGQFGTMPRDGSYPGMQRDADSSRNISSVANHGSERNHRMPRNFGRHNYVSGEHGNYIKEGVASFAMPAPEKKITLLTKIPRVEAPSTETISNNSTLCLDSNQGNEGCQQKTRTSKIEADKIESRKDVSAVFEVKGAKKADKFLESKKLDGGVVKLGTKDISFSNTVSEITQDAVAVNFCNLSASEIEAGVTESSLPQSPKTWKKAAGRSDVNSLSSTPKPLTSTTNENIQDSELKAQMNNYLKFEVDSHGRKISKLSHECAHSSATIGIGSKAVCTEPTKPIVLDDSSYRDDVKAKMKALNHKSEKEWRPKSPIVESKAPGLRAGKGGKRSEQLCNAESVKEVSSQECSTGSIVLEIPSTQKADKRRVFRNVESLSPSASSGIKSSKEAPFLRIEDSNSAQSQVVEVAVDQPSQSKNEGTFVLEASSNADHSTARASVKVLHADAPKVTATEGLILKCDYKAKPRQSNHKVEKEWRPKSPAVDSTAASDNVSGSQASEANTTSTSVCDIDILDLKISEQEGLQPLDAYDYEGQRAKLKEIAAQRAKQRRKEEEERIKEQKAKALAKLEELNRRTLANPTSVEMVEPSSVVCMDEVPNKKTKKKINPSRRSSVDVPVQDSGALEKQFIDEDMVWEPVKNSTSIPATPAFHKKHTTEVGEDSKELPSNEVILSQNSRIKRDEPARNSLKTAEKHQLHKSLTATCSYQEQRQQSRRERSIHEEDLPCIHETEVEASSSKKFGIEMRKGDAEKSARLHGGRRQTALTSRNEMKGTVEDHRELEQPNPSSFVPQTGDSQDKVGALGKAASRWLQQSSVEGQKQSKAGEPSVLEPFAIGSPEKNTLINADAGQQSAGNSHLGQKQRSEMEGCFTTEQVQSFGIKQPMESTFSSDASYGSEKLGRSHVSWRQKSLNHLPHSDKPISSLNKNTENALEESLDMPSQSQKSHKAKNFGKEYMTGRHQRGQIQLEVRELCVGEEKRTAVSGSAISELTGLNADISKHEVEAKASESVKTGRSHNSRRQKSITNVSYIFKQASLKELNERHRESPAATEAAFEEIVDPTYLHAVSTSNPHNPIAHTKQSPRAYLGAPSGHKHRSMKLSNATLSPGQAGFQLPLEEHTLSQVGSVSRHRLRSNVASMQGWETEQFQESESSNVGHSRKRGSQLQSEPMEVNAQNNKHQQVYSAKVAETISDQHVPAFSSKTRSNNHTHAENRKMNRQHQAGPQAFRPREQHHEVESEIRNNRGEQRPSRGRDKPSRKTQFNGCSTVAELDRRGAEPAIKTEISY